MDKYKLGLDVGSTTVKIVITDENGIPVFSRYRRHLSDVRGELKNLLEEAVSECGEMHVTGTITGSGGLTVAQTIGLPFIQEVVAGAQAVQTLIPDADVVLELGGEDAKITYMHPQLEQRMNGTCAGGTGAFVDQMAALLATDADGLNTLASEAAIDYPVAARCGVFAKSDIQPLLNDGADKHDLAGSILQAVVNQTLSGLACGRPVKGNVAFLGGPLHYLTELRKRFIDTLHLKDEQIITPPNAHLYVALGAALMADGAPVRLADLAARTADDGDARFETRRLSPLFESEDDLRTFQKRHAASGVQTVPLSAVSGPCYLGIDAGSTTIKAILLDKTGRIAYRHYSSNAGAPLEAAVEIMRDLYRRLPDSAWIAGSCSTGYGEGILKAALRLDHGEVETVAHYRAAREFCADVDFIIDIGGQDMKCLRIRDGVIDEIMLNEACSSGCGSFLETFAASLEMDVEDFASEALKSRNPVDLGTRCTVFMNSRVKQAQKEGASVGDIAAGLACSVVKNALYKVIKLKDAKEMGVNVVVQGGTFRNDSILRAFEKELGRPVIRPEIAECMGAYGSALIARDRAPERSSIMDASELSSFNAEGHPTSCRGCSNRCRLTITRFSDGTKYISGNRCEKGAGHTPEGDLPNLFAYKYERVFDYVPLESQDAPLGSIGVPRALNMYEDYPFWFTVLTELGFRVVLSDPSSHEEFARAMETVPSESVCYPAKLTHGHVDNLISKGITRIMYPCLPYEQAEYPDANNHYNCPIVTSYPEVLKNNMPQLRTDRVQFVNFFVGIDNRKFMEKRIWQEFSKLGVTRERAARAVQAGYRELDRYHSDIRAEGERVLGWLREKGKTGIVLVGRPYHADPEINHGIPELITSYGFAVLTEDSVAHLGHLERPVRVMDQWAYHTRMYEAAAAVAHEDCLELVQLNSFGCGLDAITSDQLHEILSAAGKPYTLLKIDEISNLGAARIRVRSLIAALADKKQQKRSSTSAVYHRRPFTTQMRKTCKIVCPQLAPLQFQFLKQAFDPTGYDFEVLTEVTKQDIDVGLKYVNNDACYPTIIVVGQLVNAFLTGRLDPDHTVIMLTQTGGGCRASNYLAFLRKALREAGYPQVVVASINFSGLERNPGLKFTGGLAVRLLIAMSLGDLLQRVLLATRPYEKNKGESDRLFEKWVDRVKEITSGTQYFEYRRAAKRIVEEFDAVERTGEIKPKVGLVGEILVKYHPDANNHAIDVIESEGGECVMPALLEFFTYGLHSTGFQRDNLGRSSALAAAGKFGVGLVNSFRRPVQKALRESRHFTPFPTIEELAAKAQKVTSLGHATGEGWFLTAEMINLIEEGVPNIICVQPFACLPNHVVGKGMIRAIQTNYPQANIVAVDYDPGASEVNQLNRIKLMMYTAARNVESESRAQLGRESRPAGRSVDNYQPEGSAWTPGCTS